MFKKFSKVLSNNLVVLIGLSIIVFISYSSLFNSYFESDEWFYFTHYFPLTVEPYGALTAIISTFIDADYISGSQHVVPVASLIYFINTKILGLNFAPYAFMSLLLHSINSFLVFLFIKALLHEKDMLIKNFYSILGAIFFAISSVPMHAITWAGFYGQSVLSVTFFILCLLYYKFAFIKKKKKFIYFSIIFLLLALFTKESTAFLFFLLPLMTLIEKRVFPIKFLGKIFLGLLAIYLVFRFIIPNISTLPDKIVDSYLSSSSSYQIRENKAVDKGIITSRAESIHENLLGEITFRTVTFPIKMVGSIFLPSQTAFQITQVIIPVIYPSVPGDSGVVKSAFTHYSGQSSLIYLLSIVIILFCIKSVLKFKKLKKFDEAKSIIVGLSILALSALPLVPIIFTFPTWGYAIYFDSRHYYNPAVGAAILFPFIIFGIANLLSRSFKIRNALLVALFVFVSWLVYNAYAFDKSIKVSAQNYGADRREVVKQLTNFLPELPNKTVFYFEKDGTAPFTSLPFFTSVSQALSVVYYERNPLPNSFFTKPLFDGDSQGYQFSDGRGFGYYVSKKNLTKDLFLGKFSTDDIYAFYYYGNAMKIEDITSDIREEMEEYIIDAKQNFDWVKFTNSTKTFSLVHPATVQMRDEGDFIQITSNAFNYELFFSDVTPSFSLNEYLQIRSKATQGEIMFKKVTFDKFHFNEAGIIQNQFFDEYYVKLKDSLFYLEVNETNTREDNVIEKILGSLELIEK